MGAGHGSRSLEVVAAGTSPVHRLDPRAKIVGLIGMVVVAVTTPPGAWAAYAAYGAALVGLVLAARLPGRHVLSRMTVELPFLAAAVLLPFVVEDGREIGGTLAARITIAVLAMVLLSSTTPFPRLLHGFEALRTPRVIVLIVSFMWRYLHVLADDVARMRTARESRGAGGSRLQHLRAAGGMVATLFLRSLERGERVYLAMLSRGYTGTMPALVGQPLALRAADVAFVGGLTGLAVAVRVAL
jgi:cobalt/nickel transport system permease protein